MTAMNRRDDGPASRARLAANATDPVYNIKAVVQRTGVPADTVRAWERRYGVPRPERTPAGQRRYSERDIAVIGWLRERTSEGMTISQAVSLLQALGQERAVAPGIPQTAGGPRDHAAVVRDLLAAFLRYDQPAAEAVIGEAFVLFGVEETANRVLRPALVEIGELWHRAEIPTTTEHFASQLVKRKLVGLIGVYDRHDAPWTVVIGCAPEEEHEIGALLVCLFMMRQGWQVIYLGPNVPIGDLMRTVSQTHPDMVCISASSVASAHHVAAIGETLRALEEPRPIYSYGGRAFNDHPELRARVPGLFLAEDARQAVDTARALLVSR